MQGYLSSWETRPQQLERTDFDAIRRSSRGTSRLRCRLHDLKTLDGVLADAKQVGKLLDQESNE